MVAAVLSQPLRLSIERKEFRRARTCWFAAGCVRAVFAPHSSSPNRFQLFTVEFSTHFLCHVDSQRFPGSFSFSS